MITDSDLYTLEQINTGLKTDLQHFHQVDETIRRLIDEASSFPGLPEDYAAEEWTQVASDLEIMADHIRQLDQALSTDTNNPTELWARIKEMDLRLESDFVRLRDVGAQMVAADWQQQWSDLWHTIFLNLAAIRAHAAILQARSEMRARYGKIKADGMAQEILSHLPAQAKIGEATRYADEYRKAFAEYQANQDRFGGFLDVVKALLMIPEEHPDTVARRRLGKGRTD